MVGRARRLAMFVLAMLLIGRTLGGVQEGRAADRRGVRLEDPPRAKDRAMPHVGDIIARAGEPVDRASDETVAALVLKGVWFSLRLVLAGFGIGLVAGVLLAVLMTRSESPNGRCCPTWSSRRRCR